MGAKSAQAYLASPTIVAASALAGYITGPRTYGEANIVFAHSIREAPPPDTANTNEIPALAPGFPEQIRGRAIVCPVDNINTDGIYPGKYTYREDMSTEEMGAVAMENYDGSFPEIVQEGDVLITGYNFGTGSSREQAATALKAAGISAVICGSANQTYKRNAVNNGLIVIECPELLETIKASVGKTDTPTLVQNPFCATVSIDFLNSQIGTDRGEGTFSFRGFDPVCQELIALGGLEAWIGAQLQTVVDA